MFVTDSDGGSSVRVVEPEGAVEPGRADVGSDAPDFRLTALDGTQRRLSDYRGRAVVLTFVASWCNPCEKEMPLLEDAATEYGDRLQVLAVSYKDLRMDTEAFVERLGVTYPVFPDGESVVAEAYGVRAIPQTFFIDEAGVVRDRVFGITTKRALDEPLQALLALD